MAARLDVAGRLAEGLPAVEHTQTYLRACEQIGYRHPDLTGDPGQIRDWYDSEEGLDLHALDADCAALRAAGSVVTEALRLQRDQLNMLATVWTGPGSDAAVAFLRRHCEIAGAVVTEVRAAAQRCESLRDNLWQLVDARAATTTAIDDRTLAQRPAWLAAAAAVTTEASAREVVDQQVKPYVDNDIRQDWRTAMLSTRAAVTAAYDMVTDRFAAASRAYFEIPGDFGAPGRPPRGSAAGTLPAAVAAPLAGPGPSAFAPTPMTATAPQPRSAPMPAPESIAGWSGDPGLPGGSGALGSGGGLGDSGGLDGLDGLGGLGNLGGLASRIVASMGDLLGSSTGDPFDDDPFGDDEDTRYKSDPLEEPVEPKSQTAQRPPNAAVPPGDGVVPASQPTGEARPATALPAPETPPAPPAVPAPPPGPVPVGSTPCEIAANELPRAGQ
ncbi:hypothetical protein EUA02_08515 [Mycobacterium paragordonae]|uniref:hypothetical protein n=1 Tax=Mycobacterium paragordonae TaxID=1389713 RepID=UPI00105EC53F|nr:hypothetical protein [Mycobacterium paragordonae]TDK98804.1 hypothetical protein EUA02_08515 [Mycobacterium paragordonae]TDL09127.1 hypothetical protein EUA05_09035 [Mycobacterium paragordonae]